LILDNRKIQIRAGDTILSAARNVGIFIPTLCQDDRYPAHGSCGLCIVEVENKLVRACATAAIDGMKVFSSSQRVVSARKQLLELLLSAHTGDCKAPCQLACPAYSDCQGYIKMISQGKEDEAYRLMMEAHPFPCSIGRVCPRPCEAKCRRGLVDAPINIAGLKRFGADIGRGFVPEAGSETGKSVAIIGGGPGGLTAAYFLRRASHRVVVYDRMPKMGGLLQYGIPEYRLPKTVLDDEIAVLAGIGIEFENNVVGKIEQLRERFDAVIIATGAGLSRPMGIPGEDSPCVVGGIDFLRELDLRDAKDVVVIGGSNTAIDAARTALRLGAETVTIAYRRTKDEMPANPAEIAEAEDEGVIFKFLVAPMEISQGIRLQKMTLGEPDGGGRRAPVPIAGEEELLKANMIISAIGQDINLDGLQALETSRYALTVDTATFQTSQPRIYAIGDVTGQSTYAIEAIGQGRKAAVAVHKYLTGQALPWEIAQDVLVVEEKTQTDFVDTPKALRAENPIKKEAHMGINSFEEVHQNLSKEAALKEASRCLSCGCGDYHECRLIRFANEYNAVPIKYINPTKPNQPICNENPLFTYDPNKCVHCALCVNACQGKILTMINRSNKTMVAAHPQSDCVRCGNCMAVCPVGARV